VLSEVITEAKRTQSIWEMWGNRGEGNEDGGEGGIDGDGSGAQDPSRGFKRPPRRARFISDPAELAQARASTEGAGGGSGNGEAAMPNLTADGRGSQTERRDGDWEFPVNGIPPLMTTAPGYVPGPFGILGRGGTA
jgi:hypothetical protein